MAQLPDLPFVATLSRKRLVDTYDITVSELRGPLWRSPHHGKYCFAAHDSADPVRRIFDAISVLPGDGAIGGWAAAYLHGAKELDGRAWTGGLEPVLLAMPYKRRVRRAGIASLRATLEPDDITMVHGVRVTSPARTCFDLMRSAPLEDAVVAVDAMLRHNVVTLSDVADYVAARPRWRGAPVAREALKLADGAAASCPESRLRVTWVVDAGLPRPAVNRPVRYADGALAGIPDLLDIKVGLASEYDGGQHRELGQHTADNAREERLEALGLVVVRATAIDLTYQRPQLVGRLRDGHWRASQLERPRRWI